MRTAIAIAVLALTGTAHAQSPRLVDVYGPATVPYGCRAYGCPAPPFAYVPPFLRPVPFEAYAYAPPSAPILEPPPAAAVPPPALGWVYLPYTAPGPGGAIYVNTSVDGLNFRAGGPSGPIIGALANGTPVIPLQRAGNWALVAAGCALAPTYTWSVTAGGVPLSVCL